MAVERVRERVRHGGHDVPEAVIQRRFDRRLYGLIREYGPMCDLTYCFDNSGGEPRLIFARSADGMDIHDATIFAMLERV